MFLAKHWFHVWVCLVKLSGPFCDDPYAVETATKGTPQAYKACAKTNEISGHRTNDKISTTVHMTKQPHDATTAFLLMYTKCIQDVMPGIAHSQELQGERGTGARCVHGAHHLGPFPSFHPPIGPHRMDVITRAL